jgi:transcription antitermination factor NusG
MTASEPSLVARAVAKIKAEANAVQRREDSAAEKDAVRQIFSKDDSDLQPITMDESRDLIALEKIVAKGLQTFVEVGAALAEIRDRKLYKIEHATFADYCKVKWKMSDRRARQLMDSAEVVGGLAESGTIVPKTESQARPLTQLPPAQRAEAYQEAVKTSATGTPTAKEVELVVEKLKPTKAKTRPIKKAGTLRGRFKLTSGGEFELLEVWRSETCGPTFATIEADVDSQWMLQLQLRALLKTKAASGIVKACRAQEQEARQ